MSDESGNDREILNHRLNQLQDHVLYHAKNGFAKLRDVPGAEFKQFIDAYSPSA